MNSKFCIPDVNPRVLKRKHKIPIKGIKTTQKLLLKNQRVTKIIIIYFRKLSSVYYNFMILSK